MRRVLGFVTLGLISGIVAISIGILAAGNVPGARAAHDGGPGPHVCDSDTDTLFDGVFVGTDDDGPNTSAELDPQRLADALAACDPQWTAGGGGGPQVILDDEAGGNVTEAAVRAAVADACAEKEPGEEFVFSFAGHGTDPNDGPWSILLDAGAGGDEDDGVLTAAELVDMFSCFVPSVTVTFIFDACHSGAFAESAPGITNSIGDPLDHAHLKVLMAAQADECATGTIGVGGDFTTNLVGCLGAEDTDSNNDGTVSSHELMECAEVGEFQPYEADQHPVQYEPPPSVGGIAEVVSEGNAPLSPGSASGTSDGTYAALAGSIAAAMLAMAAGGWYARRRWVRRRIER